MKRIAVWAAVSSRPQAEKDSIPDQLRAGREFVLHQGGLLVAELVVSGESRSYPTIAEAIAGSGNETPYPRLLELIEARAFDVLWCRSLDRLGRTDPLIAEVQYRCQRAGALVWSEQMPPSGAATGDLYLSAIERAGAQREIMELTRRQHYGKNARARKGHMMASARVPFGYRAEYVDRVRVAVVDDHEAAGYRWMVEAFLSREYTDEQICQRMRELYPSRRWPQPNISYILGNKFYTGVVVRNARQPDGSVLRIETPGIHPPLIDLDTWQSVQRLLELRAITRRPPARSLWSGLLVCDACGSRMYSHKVASHQYYFCAGYRRGDCDARNHTPQRDVTAGVAGYLRAQFLDDADRLATLDDPIPDDPLPGLERQRAAIIERRDRLTLLFSMDRITLEEFDAQRAGIVAALDAVDAQATAIRNSAERQQHRASVVEMLQAVLPELETHLDAAPAAEANRWLRDIFCAVYIIDRSVVSVDFA